MWPRWRRAPRRLPVRRSSPMSFPRDARPGSIQASPFESSERPAACQKAPRFATTDNHMGDSPLRAGDRERLYAEAAETFGAALGRLARAYERDAERRRDLLQEIHVALWRSLSRFDGRCSLR